jgi:hypothetical protein
MRLPFLQLESDIIAHGAAEVSVLAGCSIPQALGHIALVRAWAVSHASDETPPDGWVGGDSAGRRIEAAAQWTGEKGLLLQALVDSGNVRAEPGGFRVLHLECYVQAWNKNRTAKERMRTLRERSANSGERGAKFGQQTQTQKKEEATTLSADADLPDVPEDAQPVLLDVPVTPPERPEDLQALWNTEAHPSLPRWQGMSDTRKRKAVARLKDRPLAQWRDVIRRLSASPFCRGEEGGTGWRASPDWLLQPDTADKVLEGKYDRNGAKPARHEAQVGRGAEGRECSGCGVLGEGGRVGTDEEHAWLGYECGCFGAWKDSGVSYIEAGQWARARRAGRAA